MESSQSGNHMQGFPLHNRSSTLGEQGRGPGKGSLAWRGNLSLETPVARGDLRIDGPLLALSHNFLDDAFEAGTGYPLVVRKAKVADRPVAKGAGAVFSIHCFSHFAHVAR